MSPNAVVLYLRTKCGCLQLSPTATKGSFSGRDESDTYLWASGSAFRIQLGSALVKKAAVVVDSPLWSVISAAMGSWLGLWYQA